MTKIKFDPELVAALALEINDRVALILKLFPKKMEDQTIIRHLAASAIHMASFMKDIYDHLEGNELTTSGFMEEFLNKCGCDFNKK